MHFLKLSLPIIFSYTLTFITSLFIHNYLFNSIAASSLGLSSLFLIFFFLYKQKIVSDQNLIITCLHILVFIIAGLHLNTKKLRHHKILSNLPTTVEKYEGIICDKYSLENQRRNLCLKVKIVRSNYLSGYCIKLLSISSDNASPGDLIAFNAKLVPSSLKTISLRCNNIIASAFSNNYQTIPLESANLFERLAILFIKLKFKIFSSLSRKMTRLTSALFSSLFLGKNSSNLNFYRVKYYWNILGISHYLARSGIHIMLLLIIWSYVIFMIPISYVCKQILLILISVLFYALSWPSISFTRAIIGSCFFIFCKLRRIAIAPIHVICIICLLDLLANPFNLFLLEFQLSFGLTFFLLIYSQFTQNLSNKYFRPDIN